jgi:hypothetical protein
MLKIPQNGPRGLENAMRLDRKWFARNPSRLYRARPFVAGELPADLDRRTPDNTERWTLVRQIEAGFRCRVFIYLPAFAAHVDRDESIAAMFKATLEGGGLACFPSKHLKPTSGRWPHAAALAQWDHRGAGCAQ